MGKAKDGYGAARKTESEKYGEMKAVQEKLKAAFVVLDVMGKARDEEGGGVNALFEEKKALHEEVRVCAGGVGWGRVGCGSCLCLDAFFL